MSKLIRGLSFAAAVLLAVGTAQAGLILSESFDYNTTYKLMNIGSGTGWGTNLWISADGCRIATNPPASLVYPSGTSLIASGTRLSGIVGGVTSTRVMEGSITTTNTYYMSFLANKNAAGSFYIETMNATQARFGVQVTTNGSVNMLNASGQWTNILTAGSFANDTTYMVLAKTTSTNTSVALYAAGVPVDESSVTWNTLTRNITGVVQDRVKIHNTTATPQLDEIRFGNTFTSVISGDGSINYTLAVNGGSGSGIYTNGQQVTIVASNAPRGKTFDVWTGDTQYLASAASFASNTVIMPAHAAALTATYKDLVCTLTGSAGANGTVTPSSTNVMYGSNADFVVTANLYYRIATLKTNNADVIGMTFNNISSSANFTWTNVLADGTLAATFSAQVATDPAGTPYEWLAGYGLTNYDADAIADQDSDGQKAWQEYIAGTDPTNAASVLKAAQATRNTVTWSPVTGRFYSVCWSTNLVKGFTNLADNIVYPQGSYTNTLPDTKANYYQVRVRME